MNLKPFTELVKLDLKAHTQLKPTFYRKDGKLVPTTQDKWLEYIEWAKILELLYENGAKQVIWFSEISKEKPNTLKITLIIDAVEYSLDYPIIDGNVNIENANQMQLHKAELRGFVKAVAVFTGLGLNLWMKEERQMQEAVKETEPKKKPTLSNERFENAIKAIQEGKTTIDNVVKQFDLTEDQQTKLFEL